MLTAILIWHSSGTIAKSAHLQGIPKSHFLLQLSKCRSTNIRWIGTRDTYIHTYIQLQYMYMYMEVLMHMCLQLAQTVLCSGPSLTAKHAKHSL